MIKLARFPAIHVIGMMVGFIRFSMICLWQGSLNYPFQGGGETLEIYGKFEVFIAPQK